MSRSELSSFPGVEETAAPEQSSGARKGWSPYTRLRLFQLFLLGVIVVAVIPTSSAVSGALVLIGLLSFGLLVIAVGTTASLWWEGSRGRDIGVAHRVGLYGASAGAAAVGLFTHSVVVGDPSSTAAIAYVFAPVYSMMVGGVTYLVTWVLVSVVRRLRGHREGPPASHDEPGTPGSS